MVLQKVVKADIIQKLEPLTKIYYEELLELHWVW